MRCPRYVAPHEPQRWPTRCASPSSGSRRNGTMGRRPGAVWASAMVWQVTPPPPACPTQLDSGGLAPYAGSMIDPFRDRVAVVTGGGSGIGAALAQAFAARGARLVLADIDPAALAHTADALSATG